MPAGRARRFARSPQLELFFDDRELLFLRREMSRVACNSPRREASWRAAVTMLDVEREVGSLELETLVVYLRLQCLQLASYLSEQVEGVRDVH